MNTVFFLLAGGLFNKGFHGLTLMRLLLLRTQQAAVPPTTLHAYELCSLLSAAFLSRKAFPAAAKLTVVILDENASCPFLQLSRGEAGRRTLIR